MTNRWQLSVDAGNCIGSGLCSANAPAHFKFEGGVSVPRSDEVDEDSIVLHTAESCPAEAITVTALPSGRILAGPELG